ncbi:hypothetical protein LXA43DRAFT_1055531 [Ganoderma leucocontextum]|nr:hypothetical protein LXA43DRAFT_1055531 [Ganoderma leucocontextum]
MHRRTASRTKDADKPLCANAGPSGKCKRGRGRATDRCPRAMCRWCCAERGGCSVPDHRTVASKQSVNPTSSPISNASTLSQPPPLPTTPIVPIASGTAPSGAPQTNPPLPPPLPSPPPFSQPSTSTIDGEVPSVPPPTVPPRVVSATATMVANDVVSVFAPIDPRIGQLREMKVAQHLTMEAQMRDECKAREEEERTGVVWLWTQANKDPRIICIDVTNWPNLRVGQQEELQRALPPGTTDVEIFMPAFSAWVQHSLTKIFKMSTRKSKDEPAPPVLMRVLPNGPQGDSLHEEEQPGLPAYARAKSAHPRSVDTIDEPPAKRVRLAVSGSDPPARPLAVIDANVPADSDPILALSQSPAPATPSSDSTRRSLEHVTPSLGKSLQGQFPSIFFFCFVWHLCYTVEARRREAPATMSWDRLMDGFEIPGCPSLKLAHSTYNRMLSDFRKGTPAVWKHFLQLGRNPAATISEYRKTLKPNTPSTPLPWESGSPLDGSEYTCVCHSVNDAGAPVALDTPDGPVSSVAPPVISESSVAPELSLMDMNLLLAHLLPPTIDYDYNAVDELASVGDLFLDTDELIFAVENSHDPLTPQTIYDINDFLNVNP